MSERSGIDRVKTSGIVILFLVALPSVALHYFLGTEVKTLFGATTLIAALSTASRLRFERSGNLALVLAVVAGLTAVAWFWSTLPSQLLMGVTLLSLITLGWTAATSFDRQSMNLLYGITIVILIGAWIGFVYSLGGGGPTLCFENPDRRLNCLYLATFSNSDAVDFWGAIRPAGIFDEPGALSFYVTLVVCLNELCNGGRKRSFILFSLGLVTLSLAHVFCFAVYTAITLRKRVAYLALALVILAGPISEFVDQQVTDTQLGASFLDRFSIQDGRLAGDNRTEQMIEFFSLVDSDVSRYGNNAMIKYRQGGVSFTDQSAHPFSIWFGYGFIIWIPYAVTILVLLYNVFDRRRPVQVTAILLVLLLVQRPYIYSLYWGFAVWSIIAFMFIKKASLEVPNADSESRLIPSHGPLPRSAAS